MRKGTKKNIIHGILIIFVIIFALMASLIAAFRDVTVQSMVARSLAGELSKKLNTDVKIRTFYITDKLTARMDDVVFNDLDGFPMFEIGQLDAKFYPLAASDDLRIREVYLKDVLGRIVKYEGYDKINIKEILEQLGLGKNKGGGGVQMHINDLRIDNGHVIFWNQNKDKPEKLGMDYAHLDIDSIYSHISNLEMRNDTVLGDVHYLRGKDRSGLVLNNAQGNVLFCEKSLNVDNLVLETGESRADLDLRFEYGTSHAYLTFVDSVMIHGNIRQSTILLSDLRYFSWVLDRMPDKFVFTGQYDGTVSDFTVRDFMADFGNESYIDADISFKGLPHFFDTYIDVEIRKMYSSYEDTRNFAIPASSETVPIPEMLAGIGKYSLSGNYQGYPRDFRTQFDVISEMGDVNANVYLNTDLDKMYSFDISGNKVKLDDIIGTDDGAEATFQLVMNGEGLDEIETDFSADLYFKSLIINKNEFDDFNIHGEYEQQKLQVSTDVNHPLITLALNSSINFRNDLPAYNIKVIIDNADLKKLNLLDNEDVMQLSTIVHANFSGDNIDNITGKLEIQDTKYFNGEDYRMKDFRAEINEISGLKDVNIKCDFFEFVGFGVVNTKTLVNSVKNTMKSYIDMPEWFADVKPDTEDQNFSFNVTLFDTRQLSKLFLPSLYVRSGTTIQQTYNNIYASHTTTTVSSPEIWFNGVTFNDLFIQSTAAYDGLNTHLTLKDIVLRDSTEANPDAIKIEDFRILSKCADDKITADLYWDDIEKEDHNKVHVKSLFTPYETAGGRLDLSSDLIRVNDTIWHLNPNCHIDFHKNRTDFDSLELYTKSQNLAIHGVFPKRVTDTLVVEFNDFDISNLDFVTKGNNLNFDGTLNGNFSISGLSEEMAFSSNMILTDCYINGQEVGKVNAFANWYDPNESVMLDVEVYNRLIDGEGNKSVGLFGFYYPKKDADNLHLDMFLNDFRLETVSPFASKLVTRMGGYANGNLKVRGSVSNPEVSGVVTMRNAGCSVNYLNNYYTFSDKITLENNKILFENIAIHDTLGNTATLNGAINHDHLRDFAFDLNLRCNDFIALNIPAEQAQGFYGTAIADGTVIISGPVNDISMKISALTKKGTEIDVPLSGTSTIENNFVVFVQKTVEEDTIEEKYVPEVVKEERNFTMDLRAGVNSDAVVNIYLPQNMGNISSRGTGLLNIGLSQGNFELRGDYRVQSGTFNFTLEMVKKTFSLREGGTIRWTGDPSDADIDIIGVYHTKSSLTSLGTEIVDSTALTNNVNVDCIIRLTNKLTDPTITFGIELPNAKEDTRNIVFSVIDTTNQAVMAQQVFSLMMLSSFSYTAGNNISRFGTNAGYGVITRQLSSLLSQIHDNIDVGINYTPNDRLTNEELEVALTTQLFDDRLIIEGNFGVIRGNRSDADNANNIVGDVDLTFRLTRRLSLKAYNHTNIKNNYYYYSIENYSDFTQGVGLSFSQSFDNLREVFTLHRRKKNKQRPTDVPR